MNPVETLANEHALAPIEAGQTDTAGDASHSTSRGVVIGRARRNPCKP